MTAGDHGIKVRQSEGKKEKKERSWCLWSRKVKGLLACTRVAEGAESELETRSKRETLDIRGRLVMTRPSCCSREQNCSGSEGVFLSKDQA